MNKKSELLSVKLEDLILDNQNPRFAELYSGSDNEDEIIDYLLYNESAEDIVKAVTNVKEFYPDKALWVFKQGQKYIVKDGNRRCAAIKALQHPAKYGLGQPKLEFKELPVYNYFNLSDLEDRIRQEHTSTLFKQWDRIAKALEIYRLFKSGNSIESLTAMDSAPKDFIKLASFYYEAVKIGEEDLKKLLRSGRGKTGGKTIIFERLFKYRTECGYSFSSKTHETSITNQELFDSYIRAMVAYLIDHPETKTQTVDDEQADFLLRLRDYGFPPKVEEIEVTSSAKNEETGSKNSGSDNSNSSETNSGSSSSGSKSQNESAGATQEPLKYEKGKRKSIKHKPIYVRKRIPAALEQLINECYNLDQNHFYNAKTALTRVTFECTLKFVVENTNQSNGKALSVNNYFRDAFYRKGTNDELPTTNFDYLKAKFAELIKNKGFRKAFEDFNLEHAHQVIHNYRVGATPLNSKAICDNLIDLIEFMLQDEADLLDALDLTKL